MKSFLVQNLSHGRLEVPGLQEPLFFGGTHVYVGELPEQVKYLLGRKKVKITEILPPPAAKPAPDSGPTVVKKSDEKNSAKPSDKSQGA